MKIAIWGAKKAGIKLFSLISEEDKSKVVCFFDNDKIKCGEQICGKNVCSFEDFKKQSIFEIDTILITARNADSVMEILEQIGENESLNVGIVKLSALDYGQNISVSKLDKNVWWVSDIKKPVFWYLQAILIKSCNLNCKGCSHFANLHNFSDEDNIYNIEQYKHDIDILAANTEIFRLRILGGEPLLLNNLDQYIIYTRNKLPNTDIRLVTNALLFLKVSKQILESIYANDIGIEISPYPPTLKMIDKVIKILDEYNIKYSFNGYELNDVSIQKFSKIIDLSGKCNPFLSMKNCFSRGCRTIFDGNLYKCPIDFLISKLFNYFSLGEIENTPISIQNEDLDWENIILSLFKLPVETCKFCSQNLQEFEWNIENTPQLSDWII